MLFSTTDMILFEIFTFSSQIQMLIKTLFRKYIYEKNKQTIIFSLLILLENKNLLISSNVGSVYDHRHNNFESLVVM